MKILLDENFPLALVRKLRDDGYEVEHIILLGLRGIPDSVILERLNAEPLLFLTQDQEFLDLPATRSTIIVSRVTQSLPLKSRVEAWRKAVGEYLSRDWNGSLFEVFDDGTLTASLVLRSGD